MIWQKTEKIGDHRIKVFETPNYIHFYFMHISYFFQFKHVRRTVLVMMLALLSISPAVYAQKLKLELMPSATDSNVPGIATQLYRSAQRQLLQVRTVTKQSGSQSSVGSGFIVSPSGHIISNYHVVQDYLFYNEWYVLRYRMPDGEEGSLEVIDIDVPHDLALLRVVPNPKKPRSYPYLEWRDRIKPLEKGDRIYSLGNPEDIGFSIVEGTYNGYHDHMFTKLIHYTGPVNKGMSGGPVLDDMGQVIGVNVSSYRGKELSFLVPAEYAQTLYEKNKDNHRALPFPVFETIQQQLLAFQDTAVAYVMGQPWRSINHPRYNIPLPNDVYFRCWADLGFLRESKWQIPYEYPACNSKQPVFVQDYVYASDYRVTSRIMNGSNYSSLRFVQQYSDWFVFYGIKSFRHPSVTSEHCTTTDISANGLPLRVSTCLSGYMYFPKLYNLNIISATVDSSQQGVISELSFTAISAENAKKLSAFYIGGFGWKK